LGDVSLERQDFKKKKGRLDGAESGQGDGGLCRKKGGDHWRSFSFEVKGGSGWEQGSDPFIEKKKGKGGVCVSGPSRWCNL